MEELEEPGGRLGGKTDAVVAHGQRHAIPADLGAQPDVPAACRVTGRVVEQVRRDLTESDRISIEPDGYLGHRNVQVVAGFANERLARLHRGGHDARDCHALAPQLEGALVDPRHLQQVVDEPDEVAELALHHVVDPAGVDRPFALHAQDLEAVAQRGEGVTQLVRKHRYELVFSPVGGTQGFLTLPRGGEGLVPEPRDLQARVDPGEQLPRAERFDHVVVSSLLERLDAGFFASARRQQHDGHLAQGTICPHRARELLPVELRHHDVGQDEIRPRPTCRRERLLSVGDGLDVIVSGEQPRDVLAHVAVVVRPDDAPARPLRGLRHRRRRTGKPPQRLLDKGVGPVRGRRERAAGSDPLAGEVRCPERHAHLEGAAAPLGALGLHVAAVHRRQLLHQREADPGPLVRAALRPLDAAKAVEDVSQVGRGDARPGVDDLENRARVAAVQADRDAPLEGELERVGDEVEDDLLPHLPIDVDGLGERRAIDDQLEPPALRRGSEARRQIGGQRGQVHRDVARLNPARLDAREVEQRVDQLLQAPRAPPGDLEPRALGVAERFVCVLQQVFDGSRDERERGAELVADVAEERRLRAIELGEHLGALTLVLGPSGHRQSRRDVGPDQPQEVAVRLIDPPARADAGDEPRRGRLPALRTRHDGDLSDRLRPRAGAQRTGPRQRLGLEDLEGRNERPERASARTKLSRGNGSARLDAAGAHQRRRTAVAASGVEKDAREIFGVAGQDGRRRHEHVGDARRLLGDPAEIAQQPQPALADHPPGRLVDDAEHAVHAPGLVAHGIVRKVEGGLLEIAVALEKEGPVLRPESLTGPEHRIEQLLQPGRPELGPRFANGRPERRRVLAAEDGKVRVVVKGHEVGTPEHRDLGLRRQQMAERAPQALRPSVHGPERRLRPVQGADALPHLAPAGEKTVMRVHRHRIDT